MISGTISHYRILSKLGAAGMGEVYLAEDLMLGRKVAIKLLSKALFADERSKKRLLREAQTAATLDHPNICTIHEVGDENGLSFIVMQPKLVIASCSLNKRPTCAKPPAVDT